MRLVTLVRCVKSHRAEGKMDMILGGLKDFQCQKWVYSHAKDEETAYLEQLEKICRKIEIDENNYFFYPYSLISFHRIRTLFQLLQTLPDAFVSNRIYFLLNLICSKTFIIHSQEAVYDIVVGHPFSVCVPSAHLCQLIGAGDGLYPEGQDCRFSVGCLCGVAVPGQHIVNFGESHRAHQGGELYGTHADGGIAKFIGSIKCIV